MANVKPTRRDWFRLRILRENRMLGEKDNSTRQDVLQPTAQPPNHDGMDLSQLPPLREALLNDEQIDQLFSDIGCLATEVSLMQRPVGAARANAQIANSIDQLEFAKCALLSGKMPRVQIRYRWQNALWIDTLARQVDGVRLIRIQHAAL